MLWDADCEDAHNFVDQAPEHAATMHKLAGIDRDYFTALPPDPRDEELPELLQRIRELSR